MFRHRIAVFSVSAFFGILAFAQGTSADTIGGSLTGYTFMGGANVYTSTEASHSKTYFLSQPLNMDYSGANYWGYAWMKFDDLGDTTVGSAVLHLNLLGVGSMSVTPASSTNPTALELYSAGATDVADLGGSDDSSLTLRQTLRDTLDASSPFNAITITADGDVAIDITDLYNSWVSGAVENNGFVLCSSDDGNGGKFSTFGSAAGAPYIAATAVPEPGTAALAMAALVGLGFLRAFRHRSRTTDSACHDEPTESSERLSNATFVNEQASRPCANGR